MRRHSLTWMGIAMWVNANKQRGFTLLEILIALFVFTILSVMMTGALRTVINAQSGAERNAARVRHLQIVFVRMARDIEQVVNRPVKTAVSKDSPAFLGTPEGFAFTHNGIAGPNGRAKRTTLQRAQYIFKDGVLWRMAWEVLDQSSNSPKPYQRDVLNNVTNVRFSYLDKNKRFHQNWPVKGRSSEPLPSAVRVRLTVADWGKVEQLYVIPVQVNNQASSAPKS